MRKFLPRQGATEAIRTAKTVTRALTFGGQAAAPGAEKTAKADLLGYLRCYAKAQALKLKCRRFCVRAEGIQRKCRQATENEALRHAIVKQALDAEKQKELLRLMKGKKKQAERLRKLTAFQERLVLKRYLR